MIASKCCVPLRRMAATEPLLIRTHHVSRVDSDGRQLVVHIPQTLLLLRHNQLHAVATHRPRLFSTATTEFDDNDDSQHPMGDLFEPNKDIGPNLIGQTASITRVFGPGANAKGLLTCGGEELARHASFDPNYDRAKGWIQNRPIGPAVLSPILISGLVGALVEAAFPQAIPASCSMRQNRPLIVGAKVCAEIKVASVEEITKDGEAVSTQQLDFGSRKDGYCIKLETKVVRVQDDSVIADGAHSVWFPKCISRHR